MSALIGMQEDIAEIRRTAERIETVLNGPTGLVTKVEMHENWMKRIDQSVTEWKRVIISVGITLLLGALALIWSMINHTIVLTKVP